MRAFGLFPAGTSRLPCVRRRLPRWSAWLHRSGPTKRLASLANSPVRCYVAAFEISAERIGLAATARQSKDILPQKLERTGCVSAPPNLTSTEREVSHANGNRQVV